MQKLFGMEWVLSALNLHALCSKKNSNKVVAVSRIHDAKRQQSQKDEKAKSLQVILDETNGTINLFYLFYTLTNS